MLGKQSRVAEAGPVTSELERMADHHLDTNALL